MQISFLSHGCKTYCLLGVGMIADAAIYIYLHRRSLFGLTVSSVTLFFTRYLGVRTYLDV
ncbi:hypothetical protein F4823DRAFT_600179, partial [Ustulina deusta]